MNKLERASLYCLLFFIAVAIISVVWTPYQARVIDMESVLQSPSMAHWLGTDALGRDVLSRIMIGTTITLGISFIAVCLTMLLGTVLGILSGYMGGWVDTCIQAVVTTFQSIPSISLMVAIAGILEPGLDSLIIAVLLTSWSGFSRIVRSEVLVIMSSDYVTGGKALGASNWYLLSRYVWRRILPLIIVLFTVRLGYVILSIAGLSFIGLGIQPPLADWGTLIQEGQTYYRTYPALVYAPGICIVALAFSINTLGDYLKERYM